ncbi:GNAT family N-acetyltransferase [Rubrolithibacter danxiaensis]|uniref:GNAT family N-acetyltransferase n=1 Tax=Rubrolithibacter danxiaensis TaxID=3390805 RepID=UPI003BF7F287
MLQIIRAELSDLHQIQTIAYQTWPVTFKNILSDEQIEYMLEMMYSTNSLTTQVQDKQHVFLLAMNSNEFKGFTSYELNYKGSKATKIHKIYILPGQQGKGIGKSLLDKVSEIALKNSNSALSLNVNRQNAAIDFYRKYGFKIVAEENIPIGNGFLMEDYVMEKLLYLPIKKR